MCLPQYYFINIERYVLLENVSRMDKFFKNPTILLPRHKNYLYFSTYSSSLFSIVYTININKNVVITYTLLYNLSHLIS